MFGLLKSQKPYAQAARGVYGSVLENIRKPEFYTDYGVPDSFDGRFDLMLLHIFLVLDVALAHDEGEAEGFNQALFDQTFKDMDQTLREMGIGDVGVPKHMRKMMKAFNGRMHAYDTALKAGDLAATLGKNLYGTVDTPDEKQIAKMAQKAQEMLSFLKTQDREAIFAGRVIFEEG